MEWSQVLFAALMMAGLGYLTFYVPYREKKALDQVLAALTKDDRVITASGIHGKVVQVDGERIVLEIAEKTRVTFDRSAIAKKADVPVAKK